MGSCKMPRRSLPIERKERISGKLPGIHWKTEAGGTKYHPTLRHWSYLVTVGSANDTETGQFTTVPAILLASSWMIDLNDPAATLIDDEAEEAPFR